MRSAIHGGGCGDSCCLRVQNLSVKIDRNAILRDVSLHVHCGEMVALIGPTVLAKAPSSRLYWGSGNTRA